jgi:TatD DNase family protein
MIEFVDTHTHIFTSEFDVDRADAVQRALDAGVRTLCLPAINEDTLPSLMAMCDAFPNVCRPMIGLHPTELGEDYDNVLNRLYALLKNDDRFVAIGEVGLDYYWDDTKKKEQIDVLQRQIEWALETGLPLAIHSRSAFDDLYAVMDKYRGRGLSGVFHCFSGTDDEARKLLSFDGFYLGIGGVATYKKSTLPDVLENVPLERIVLETDCPFLTPRAVKKERNDSGKIKYIIEEIAKLKGISCEDVINATNENIKKVYPKL